ncbi:MAG: exo-beta-1,3-glucanase, partial [Methylococcales bacterium]|nr:exo-beta-1,3-glucanase [Methylococcales bacterium]
MHIVRVLLSLLLVILVHGIFGQYANQPRDAGPDVPSGKLMSLSFAPFREGYSPLEKNIPLPEHIEEDMRLLADKTVGIRTYSSLGGLQPIPEIARKYGMKMIQGGWLDNSYNHNRREVDALIASANSNPDVVK